MHVGVAHHLGWAVLVTATADHQVADRRRVELLHDDLPSAPIHHRSGVHPMHDAGDPLDDEALGELAATVRVSAAANIADALDALADDLAAPIETLSVRDWPADFPTDIATLRAAPYESQADSVMYRQVIADAATERGWVVRRFDAKVIEAAAIDLLDDPDILVAPRSVLGARWNKDHRIAFAAAILAAAASA